jgi:hypothetical protein
LAIIFALLDAVVARGDDGLGPEGLHLSDEAVSVIRPVGDHPLGTEALKQRRGLEMSVAAWNLVVSPAEAPDGLRVVDFSFAPARRAGGHG